MSCGKLRNSLVAEMIIFTFTEVFLYSDAFHGGNNPSMVERVQNPFAKMG